MGSGQLRLANWTDRLLLKIVTLSIPILQLQKMESRLKATEWPKVIYLIFNRAETRNQDPNPMFHGG